MMEQQTIEAILRKAQESLDAAESDYANQRYISCANRCYYACFQAAVAALLSAGIGPRDPRGQWGHDYVQAAFCGHLIHRRKQFPGRFGSTLTDAYNLRERADYKPQPVTRKQAERALRRSSEFVRAASRQGDWS